MDQRPADEIEKLLSRMEHLDPPDDFLQHVLGRARAAEAVAAPSPVRRGMALYASAYLLALAVLAVLAYELGLALGHNGTSALISALLSDLRLVGDAPGLYLGAVVSSLPWVQLAGVAIDLAIVFIMTRLLLRGGGQNADGRHAQTGA